MNSLRRQGLQMAQAECPGILGQQIERGLGGELLADDRGSRDHGPLAGPEPVEARLEQRVDRRGDRQLGLVAAPFGEHGDELLDEEGVSLGGLEHSGLVSGARSRARLPISASHSRSGRRSSTSDPVFASFAGPVGSLLQ